MTDQPTTNLYADPPPVSGSTIDEEDLSIREFDVRGTVRLIVEAHSGEVSVDAGAAGRVRVEAHSSAGRELLDRVRITQDGDVVRVIAPRGQRKWFSSGDDVSFRIVVPAGSAVEASTASGELTTVGDLGDLDVRTASGEISVDSAATLRIRAASGDSRVAAVTGDCRVSSASGDVEVGEVGGRVLVETASGDVTIGEVGRDVEVSTASGDIEVATAGGQLRASSVSGDVRVGAVHGARAQVNSASGDLEIGVPAGVAAWLDLTSASGDVRTDLTDAGEPEKDTPVLEIRAVTASGDIHIRRS